MTNHLFTLIKAYTNLCDSVWMKWTDVHHLTSASLSSCEPNLWAQKRTHKTEVLNIQE